MPLFHVKHTICTDVTSIKAVFGYCGQDHLSPGRIQFREAPAPAVCIEFRCQVVDQHYRRMAKDRSEISNLCDCHRSHEQLRLTTGKTMMQWTAVNGEPQIRPDVVRLACSLVDDRWTVSTHMRARATSSSPIPDRTGCRPAS